MEKLGGREIYGKQVLNPTDVLTTDGTMLNKFDFFDADSREKSIAGTTFKLAAQIAPFLIPGVNLYYGGVSAAVGLASVLPTFYKSFEGMLLGDTKSGVSDLATAAEGYMAKFKQKSYSDEAQGSMFNYEQLGDMVASTFSQIYEQRAAASLAKVFMKNGSTKLSKEGEILAKGLNEEMIKGLSSGKIAIADFESVRANAMMKVPELKAFLEKQSSLSKALNLGYMAMTSSADTYGDAIEGGYDRRTAGFATIAVAAGQYGIMVNNPMGDWFLDKTTGYDINTNKALMKKTVREYLEPIKDAFKEVDKNPVAGKAKLAGIFGKIKNSLNDVFSPSELGENLWKHALVEGTEEVSEQLVQDATKGMIDTMSYLGLTKKKGSFGGTDVIFSKQGAENYAANFIGGLLGGPMFEFNTAFIEPRLTGKVHQDVKQSLYQLIGNGQKDEAIAEINKQRKLLGNSYLSPVNIEGDPTPANKGKSQADVIADTAINMINNIDGILNSQGLVHTNEEIIKKSLLDHIVIGELEKSKGDGKVGIEGLILEDYTRNVSKIVDINTEIQNLSKSDEDKDKNKATIKQLTDESKLYKSNIDAILDGSNAEKYFGQATFFLSKQISQDWLSLDKNTFAKNKYNVEYHKLADSGVGLTKERVNKEFQDYLDNKDVKHELETKYNAYLELEKNMNPSIASWVEKGYDEVRKLTYNKILDLKKTLEIFNTAGTEAEKNAAIENYMQISNDLKAYTKKQFAPWDMYRADVATNYINNNLVGKYDEEGNFKPLSQTELDESIDHVEGKVKKVNYIIDTLSKDLPPTNFSGDKFSEHFNNSVAAHNATVDREVAKLASGEITPEIQDKISDLESSKVNFVLGTSDHTTEIGQVNHQFTQLLESKLPQGYSEPDEELEAYYANPYNGKIYNLDDFVNDSFIADLNNIVEEFITLNPGLTSTVNDNLIDQIVNGETDPSKLLTSKGLGYSQQTQELLVPLIEKLTALVADSKTNTYKYNKIVNNEDLNSLISAEWDENLKSDSPNIDGFLEDLQSKLTTFEQYNSKGSVYEDYRNYHDYKNNEWISEKNQAIANARPDFLKINNIALDLLLDNLSKAGKADMEMFKEAKVMVDNRLVELGNSYLKGFTFNNNKDILTILNDVENIKDIFENAVEEEYDEMGMPTGDNVQTYSTDVLSTLAFPDEIKQLLSDDESNEKLYFAILTATKAKANLSDLKQLNKFYEIADKSLDLIENELYNFLGGFSLSLEDNSKSRTATVFDILRQEEQSLVASSSISNYLSEGIKNKDIQQAINTLKLAKSVVNAMSTTELSYGDPIGFIASRQAFVKKNKIESETGSLKTITSDTATLMNKDLDRLINKLEFILNISKNNSSKMFNEQEAVRKMMTSTYLDVIKELFKKQILYKGSPVIPDLNDILSSKDDDEKKLMKIESLIYEANKNNKLEVLKLMIGGLDINLSHSTINKDFKSEDLTDYERAIYFATILSINSRDHMINSLNTLSDPEFNKSPFYTQELASKIMMASTVEPDLFQEITNNLSEHDKSLLLNTDLITYALGGGGTGKTTVVFKMFVKNLIASNPNMNVWFTGPHKDQATKLAADVLEGIDTTNLNTDTFRKSDLYEKLGITELMNTIDSEKNDFEAKTNKYTELTADADGFPVVTFKNSENGSPFYQEELSKVNLTNLPNVLLIDEITHFSAIELAILNEVSRMSKTAGNFMKIIAAGDTNQIGSKLKVGLDAVEYNVNRTIGIFSPTLNIAIRAANMQKRDNNDSMIGVIKSVSEIYSEDYDAATKEQMAIKVLSNIQPKLHSFVDPINGVLNGDIIAPDLNQDLLKILKTNLEKGLKVGILTEHSVTADGLSDTYKNSLQAAGISLNDPNLKVFSLGNIQGNESDYFVFDTSLIKSAKINHKLKEFYTYISRAKNGTIIVDPNLSFTNSIHVSNAKDDFTEIREPLTAEVIAKTKETRIKTIKDLLDNDFNLVSDPFKFNTKTIDTSDDTTLPANTVDVDPNSDFILTNPDVVDYSDENGQKVKTETTINPKTKVLQLPDDFKYMFHTFYNNWNAIIEKDADNKVISIQHGVSETNTDFNFAIDVNQPNIITGEEADKLFKTWSKIKNVAIFKDLKTNKLAYFDNKDVKKFLSKALLKTPINSSKLNVDYVLTASRYNDSVNKPGDKYGYDNKKTLLPGEAFINLSLKVEYDGAIHYITLANIGKNESTTYEFGKNSKKAYDDKIVEINTFFESNPDEKIIEIGSPIDFNSIEIKTSTRLIKQDQNGVKNTKKTTLANIANQFPGSEVESEDGSPKIFFYPSQPNYEAFKSLINSFSFGEKRTEDQIKALYNKYAGKPYIKLSFFNDFEGSKTKDIQTKLIPVFVESRSALSVKAEVEKLYVDHNDAKSEAEKNKTKISKNAANRFSKEFNSMISPTQVLD